MPASPADYVSPFAPREFSARAAWAAWACVVGVTLLWLGLIVAAPLAAAGGREATAFMLYHGLKAVCHQMPERAYWLAGHPLAVCARCSGIYAGFAVAVLCYPLVRSVRRMGTPRREWLVVALAPMVFDFALGITGLWANTHSSRLATGAWFGVWAAFYVVPGLIESGEGRMRRRLRMNSFAGKQEA